MNGLTGVVPSCLMQRQDGLRGSFNGGRGGDLVPLQKEKVSLRHNNRRQLNAMRAQIRTQEVNFFFEFDGRQTQLRFHGRAAATQIRGGGAITLRRGRHL
jgi:hypothetical protein